MRTLKKYFSKKNKTKIISKPKFTKFVPFTSLNSSGQGGFNQKQNNSSRLGQGQKGSSSQFPKATPKSLSLSQLLARLRQQRQKKVDQEKRQKPIKPIIPPKSLVIILKERPEKIVYNRRIIDYKHCGLLQRYIGLGGKILPRRQTRLTAKQQRYVAKTIKSARVMGLLPFVNIERGFFR